MRNETEIELAGARRLSDLDRLASEILETPDAEAAAARDAAARHLAEHAALCATVAGTGAQVMASVGVQAWH